MKRMMKLSDIKIKQSYLETIPSKEKMDECRKYWKTHSSQDRYIVVDHDDLLIDGYIQYLILKENNIEEAEIKIWHCKRRRWFRKNVENCIPKLGSYEFPALTNPITPYPYKSEYSK